MCVGMYICISRCTSASPSLPRAFSRTTAARAPAALAAFSAAYWGWQRRRMAPSHSIASCHSPTGAPPPLNRRAPPHRGHHVVEHAARRQGMARRTRCVLALRWCCILFWTRHIYLGATRPSTATHSRKGLPPSSTVGHPIRIVLLGRVAGWRRGAWCVAVQSAPTCILGATGRACCRVHARSIALPPSRVSRRKIQK